MTKAQTFDTDSPFHQMIKISLRYEVIIKLRLLLPSAITQKIFDYQFLSNWLRTPTFEI